MKSPSSKTPKQKPLKSDQDRPSWSHICDWITWILWVFLCLPIAALFKIILIPAEASSIPFERLKNQKDKIVAFILFWVCTFIVIGHFFLPVTQNFEANLLVSHIEFTTPEPNSHFFLQNIDNLTAFALQIPSETLTLRGTFTSPKNPQLSKKTELSFSFSEANSRLLFYPSTAQDLAIDELTLNSTT
ncbi:MAG: hypothetical protein J7545_09800 [Roseofilum sp. SBFL]|uniref:hypothetical protein n=1 Tax=unclassified Roseofilum TaxID=2620099 RepID=UPI001B1D281E|nr:MULTISPECIES: hypothetical protein [unclassified Roseofilum]MBP0015558.1 hypothetical protein [Roseofilum sp. SID3]MBP0022444.1 hypothetical protein [Roseofilum sp. SID2]MBP0036742.1 hypothetical protein [Roseofilum sp. SID1]MBP0042250.1 hypothetical protein [Roseofilum sp. SBFL]